LIDVKDRWMDWQHNIWELPLEIPSAAIQIYGFAAPAHQPNEN